MLLYFEANDDISDAQPVA